jgi:hypothetical protein
VSVAAEVVAEAVAEAVVAEVEAVVVEAVAAAVEEDITEAGDDARARMNPLLPGRGIDLCPSRFPMAVRL